MFEDDIAFVPDFDKLLSQCMSDLPSNWDALWLGGKTVKDSYYSGYLRKLEYGSGGYAILMRETVYELFIHALNQENELADICYANLMPKINAFKTFMNLVQHKDGYSTIQRKQVSYGLNK